MSVELHELRGFVARALNFRVAADLLHISQPALTREIKALEDKLGGPLFARGRRRAPPAGQILLDGSARLSLDREALLVQLQRTVRGEAGTLAHRLRRRHDPSPLVASLVEVVHQAIP